MECGLLSASHTLPRQTPISESLLHWSKSLLAHTELSHVPWPNPKSIHMDAVDSLLPHLYTANNFSAPQT
jgi:hypothetical protein